MKTVQQQFAVSYSFPVIFTRDAFGDGNHLLARAVCGPNGNAPRLLVVIDSGVVAALPGILERIMRYASSHAEEMQLVLPPFIVRGGELCKNDPVEVSRIHALVQQHGLCRHSCILAIGGGAVLDLAGFAAATAHRGIRLVRMPTTTLAMNDAGVSVKNGVNDFGRKNFTGCFAPPWAVINDLDFLRFLPERELRCGIAEAVKVALIRDRNFFDYLYSARSDLARFAPQALQRMIVRCAELHLEHIGQGGDPFELGSSRPLDYGHWAAHKLEEMSRGGIRHGEAVAVGIALDSLYSLKLGLIDEFELRRITATLEGVGFQLYHPSLRLMDVKKALEEFREHLGGELSIPLLNRIGERVDRHDIDAGLYRECIGILATRRKNMENKDEQTEPHHDASGDPGPLFS